MNMMMMMMMMNTTHTKFTRNSQSVKMFKGKFVWWGIYKCSTYISEDNT
jgi:hypothetical protein